MRTPYEEGKGYPCSVCDAPSVDWWNLPVSTDESHGLPMEQRLYLCRLHKKLWLMLRSKRRELLEGTSLEGVVAAISQFEKHMLKSNPKPDEPTYYGVWAVEDKRWWWNREGQIFYTTSFALAKAQTMLVTTWNIGTTWEAYPIGEDGLPADALCEKDGVSITISVEIGRDRFDECVEQIIEEVRKGMIP